MRPSRAGGNVLYSLTVRREVAPSHQKETKMVKKEEYANMVANAEVEV